VRHPPETERAALAGGPIRKSNALATPANTATEPEALQARRLAQLFFLSPDAAATIARLHFGEARA
jgi:hypothetical protein